MTEKFFYIKPEKAHELLSEIKERKPLKRGFDKHVYLIGDYAVLTVSRIKLRNVTIRDDELVYYDELIKTLMELHEQGTAVVPTLGYCYDPDSENGSGYIFQPLAKGEELFDDSVMKEYYVWARKNPDDVYFYPNDIDAREYILSRTRYITEVPQEHFDKFVRDIVVLNDNDILIDFIGKSNFFYDETAGFQFIDLDSHTDHKYGLVESKDSDNIGVLLGCFTPCHLAVGTTAFGMRALDENAISKLSGDELRHLKRDNRFIFEKCKNAVINNGFSEAQLNDTLKHLKIYGENENDIF